MKALVTIPIDLYRSIETKCRKDGPEYKLLMSGLIDKERQQLILRCDVDPALSLCAWVEKFFHGAACRIRVSPDQ
jgi:hypothetical protein